MPPSDPKPRDNRDEQILEEISGQQPPVDSYAADRASRPPRGAARTDWLGRRRATSVQTQQPRGRSGESMGLIDFIFHHINAWVNRLLGEVRALGSETAPAFSGHDRVQRSGMESLVPSLAPPEQILVTRQIPLTDLPLPAALLHEPDLKRYFEQMRLYDYQTTRGGLTGLNCREVANYLLRGKWGDQFPIRFAQLQVKGPWSLDRAYERFMGMLPVYKAQANTFPNDRALQKAIEDDIASFLRAGQGSVVFHPFFYS